MKMKNAIFGLCTVAFSFLAQADEVLIAVAANFAAPMQKIAAEFEKDTGHKVIVSLGSTGKLYAQIVNGAPYELFLSADSETPRRLAQEGFGLEASRFTYGLGKLVLWSADPALVDAQGLVLKRGSFKRIALANPKTAPYGAAALSVLRHLDLFNTLQSRFVQGENISQAYQFASTGAAELGFVALSQVMVDGQLVSGSAWRVPEHFYAPIRQDALLLNKGKDRQAALAMLAYLKATKAQAVIRGYGYTTP
jgi:molybdate transport system substrate-binding protein